MQNMNKKKNAPNAYIASRDNTNHILRKASIDGELENNIESRLSSSVGVTHLYFWYSPSSQSKQESERTEARKRHESNLHKESPMTSGSIRLVENSKSVIERNNLTVEVSHVAHVPW